ncbi:4'-phosphopantetheinyl transferase superfamily protein [Flavobacterium sp. H122]|uniref:4'-phosphopantetheinyl transferase family protein n=1 Tax=Flavobacterium sp. H122 TaxID=2529860 RepID=UPI0010AA12CB|nr:4'-phosphopantetheinyl transferase superfamily protein [Flavobacterium sp. H122]
MKILYAQIDEERHSYLLEKYLHTFPEDFVSKVQKFRRWQDAQLSLLGRVLLDSGLKSYFNITNSKIIYNPKGKPFLHNQDVFFNISHTSDLVVCSIANFPVGIDVEKLDSKFEYNDFKYQMTKNEYEIIKNSTNTVESFYSYWTEKEAVIKAHGNGLQIPLNSFELKNQECLIDEETFYVKNVFINEKYKCNIASNNFDINNHHIHIEQINLNIL